MVGVVVVTHGVLGQALLQTAATIVGPLEQSASVAIDSRESAAGLREAVLKAIVSVDTGDGVLVLTDMFGGTPTNVALSVIRERRIEVVTGCSLPMLVKLSTARDGAALADLARLIAAYGQKHIVLASEVLNQQPPVRTETARH